MGMFFIKKETPVLVIKEGRDWLPQNFKPHATQFDNVFGKEEMIIDPTGIAKHCTGPKGVTVGSGYADQGCYGFKRDGWFLVVHRSHVQYG